MRNFWFWNYGHVFRGASINPSQPFHSDPSACHVSLPENSIKFKTVSINNRRIPRPTDRRVDDEANNVHQQPARASLDYRGHGRRQWQGHAMHWTPMMQHGTSNNNGYNGCGVDPSFTEGATHHPLPTDPPPTWAVMLMMTMANDRRPCTCVIVWFAWLSVQWHRYQHVFEMDF